MTDPEAYEPKWIGPDGTEVLLNPVGQDGLFSLKAVGGLGAAPVDLVTEPDPAGGVRWRFTRPKERSIVWPLRVRGATNVEFLALWRATVEAFTQTDRLGPGLLRLTRPDGSAREIEALYASGMEGQPAEGAWLEDTLVVNLFCPDPYWRDTVATVLVRGAEDPVDFLAPYPSVSSGNVLGANTVLDNPGSVPAWPTWTLHGPATQLVATSDTRGGQSFTLAYNLLEGETLTITTSPISVTGPGGVNLIDALNWPNAQLWRLDPGSNNINFQVDGAGATTEAEFAFYPRHQTA